MGITFCNDDTIRFQSVDSFYESCQKRFLQGLQVQRAALGEVHPKGDLGLASADCVVIYSY